MPDTNQVRFSGTGEYVAFSGYDGRLRIWDTATSTLKQEFTPSSHLSAGCTCLEWSPLKPQEIGNKKKKKKVLEGEIVVMGTNIGSLLFYEVTKAQLIAHSKEAHVGKVTGISWSCSTLLLYSCGEDGYLLEWDPTTTDVISRWKGSKNGLTALSMFKNNLLASGQEIKLWDLSTKTLISSFTGHPSKIAQINAIPSSDYFISMAYGDRNLRIWCHEEKNAIASLVVPDTPESYHLSVRKEGEVSIVVVTERGLLHIFHKKLNGHIRKPLMPASTLEIKNSTSSDSTKIVPILTCFLKEEEETYIIAAYGSWNKFRFEKFDVATIENQKGSIIREFLSTKRRSEKSPGVNQIQLTEVPNDVKHLQPGTETVTTSSSAGKKRKKSEKEANSPQPDGELPMEERLTNLTLQSPAGPSGIRGNNLGHLLSQGLHSKDSRILHSVLSRWDEDVITSTIRSLPVQLVVPLLNEIKVMLAGKGQLNNAILKWLKSVLQIQSSYLMCCPAADELLGPFMSLLHSREVLYPQLCQLRGKLELIRGNIEAKQHKSEPVNEALLVFNDDSSADEAEEDDEAFVAESEDLIMSDDLGVTDSESDDNEKGTDEDKSESGSGTETEGSEDEQQNAKVKTKVTKSNNVSNFNHVQKIKGKVLDEDSGPESMDYDG